MNKKVSPAHVQLEYLDRIKQAVKAKDKLMLDALYTQCEQLNIAVPHYDIAGKLLSSQCEVNRPAVEQNEDGTLSIHMYELVQIGEVVKPLKDWCKQFKIDRSTLRHRLSVGRTLEEALTTPKFAYYTQRT